MPDVSTFYRSLIEPGDLAFDIGANIGVHANAMLKAGARVVAVEPQWELAHKLRRELRDFMGLRAVVPVAVGARREPVVTLRTSSTQPHMTTLRRDDWLPEESLDLWNGELSVEQTTVDWLISRYGMPDLLKIDVEGYEAAVLRGLSRAPRTIVFEVHRSDSNTAKLAFRILEELGHYEFEVMMAESWDPQPTTVDDLLDDLPAWGDVIARRTR